MNCPRPTAEDAEGAERFVVQKNWISWGLCHDVPHGRTKSMFKMKKADTSDLTFVGAIARWPLSPRAVGLDHRYICAFARCDFQAFCSLGG